MSRWDPAEYDFTHHYVTDYGRSLVDLLAPETGERILDLGCGTGHLTQQIADRGAVIVGIDSSPEMIAQARQNYPKLRFELANAAAYRVAEPFDAVFSNAALHWIQPPEDVVGSIAAALKPGGRLVAEFGGKGNIASVVAAAGVNRWYFPSIGEYAALLEGHGLEVTSAVLFDRPTVVEGVAGLRDWLAMFFKPPLPEETIARMEIELRPKLFNGDAWTLDYRRLRIVALKS
jgi:trans-aconitate 2-methyltransferase